MACAVTGRRLGESGSQQKGKPLGLTHTQDQGHKVSVLGRYPIILEGIAMAGDLAHRLFNDNDRETSGINRSQLGDESTKIIAQQGITRRNRNDSDQASANPLVAGSSTFLQIQSGTTDAARSRILCY
jgi:hypothetical protein